MKILDYSPMLQYFKIINILPSLHSVQLHLFKKMLAETNYSYARNC